MNTALICLATTGHGSGVLWLDISACCIYVLFITYMICDYNDTGPIVWIKNYIDKINYKNKEKEKELKHKNIVDKTNKLL